MKENTAYKFRIRSHTFHIYTSHYNTSRTQLHVFMCRGRERSCMCSQSTRLRRQWRNVADEKSNLEKNWLP